MKIREFQVDKVSFIEIKGNDFSVTLSSLGASIFEIKCGEDILTLTPQKYDDFFKSKIYHGKTIGPIANRIKKSMVQIGDYIYIIKPNENGNLLHGGDKGLSTRKFKYKIYQDNGELSVIFTYKAKHLSDGLPGNRNFKITYIISENKGLKIELKFDVTSDQNSLFRLTNHTYFNLGENGIRNLLLYLPSNRFIVPSPIDLCPSRLLPLHAELDFNSIKVLREALDCEALLRSNTKGIDHFFLFSDEKVLSLRSLKYVLNIETDFEGVQLYSDGNIDGMKFKNVSVERFRGLAIEPGDSHFRYNPTREYHRHIIYNLSKNLFNK